MVCFRRLLALAGLLLIGGELHAQVVFVPVVPVVPATPFVGGSPQAGASRVSVARAISSLTPNFNGRFIEGIMAERLGGVEITGEMACRPS